MILPQSIKCGVCKKVFCCANCRLRHESTAHRDSNSTQQDPVDASKDVDCPICRRQPLPQKKEIPNDLLLHICEKHLPLHCTKCQKTYITDACFEMFSNCSGPPVETIDTNKENESCPDKIPTSSCTQTSPCIVNPQGTEMEENVLTPISKWNMLWKLKYSKNESGDITDSASSLKNDSSLRHHSVSNLGGNNGTATNPPHAISNQSNVTGPNGKKLFRSTSTPMHRLMVKVKGGGFDSINGSSCHVSSIYSSSSESDISPPIRGAIAYSSPNSDKLHKKSAPRGRQRMPVAATPLRQVMSKSIQRAIAEHGGIPGYHEPGVQPKKIFDSINISFGNSPLDLRTSPVIRRTKSEVIAKSSTFEDFEFSKCHRNEIFSSTKHPSKDSFAMSKTNTEKTNQTSSPNFESLDQHEKLDTVYETCRSMNATPSISVESAKTYDFKVTKNRSNPNLLSDNNLPFTPKYSTGNVGILKKAISFESPISSCNDDDSDDVFYTPRTDQFQLQPATRSYSCSLIDTFCTKSNVPAIHPSARHDKAYNENYCNYEKEELRDINEKSRKPHKNGGKIWNFVSSAVMRLASFGNSSSEPNISEESQSIIKRCASFTGILTPTQTSADEAIFQQSNKRRRTTTADASNCSSTNEALPKRVKRIQGRQPIDRMRKYN